MNSAVCWLTVTKRTCGTYKKAAEEAGYLQWALQETDEEISTSIESRAADLLFLLA